MTSLNLSGKVLQDPELLAEAKEKNEELLVAIYDELSTLGIELLETVMPAPTDLSEYGDFDTKKLSELAALHAQYAGYAAFLENKTAEIKVKANAQQRLMKDFYAKASLELAAQHVPKNTHPERIHENPIYQELDADMFRLSSMLDLLKARRDGYQSQAAAISRVITARQAELESTGRTHNLGKSAALKPRRRF